MQLQDRALLVKLRIESWGTSRKDKQANRAVADHCESFESATSVNKRLVPEHSLKAVKSKADEAREYLRTVTQAWADDGGRLIEATHLFDLQDELRRKHRPAWWREVTDFIAKLDYFRDEWGPESLGKLYDARLYPTKEKLQSDFVWELDVLPLNPDSRELRIVLGNEYVDQIQREAEERLIAGLAARIAAPIENMVRRLSAADGTFKNSLVENVREIAALIPMLNLTNDPSLAALQARINNDLTRYSAEALRTSPTARSQTAQKAIAILENLSGCMEQPVPGVRCEGSGAEAAIVPLFPEPVDHAPVMSFLL